MAEPVDLYPGSEPASDRQRNSTSTPSLSEDGGLSSASSILTGDEGTQDYPKAVETIGEDEDEGESGDDEEDEEDEDEEEHGPPIPQPAYFYPSDHTQSIPAQTYYPYLHPTDDPAAQRGIPVFTPTMEEFHEFEVYLEKIAAWGHRSGIVKVIPPTEWTSALPSIPTQTLSSIRIKNPIQQNMLGRSGLFRQSTIEKKKSLSVRDWWDKCRAGVYNYPGPKDAELRKRGNPSTSAAAAGPSTSTSTSGRGSAKRRKVESGASIEVDPLESTPVPSEVSAEVVEQETVEDKKESGSDRATSSTPSTAGTDVKHASATSVNGESVDPWYQSFDPHTDWVPEGTSPADYTEDGCRSLERKFWRELGLGEACWYGADMKGSLFTEETTSWNVAHLPNLLNRLNLKRKLPGVNTPYLYWGMWAAAFAWHVEDMDLYSINYIHFGAPKYWYAIPQKKADTFERHMAGYFPSDARKCDQFLRHKSFAVSPSNLAGQGTRPNILVQKQGEFVITFPRGYHAGFNMGFNCAESINFALDDWIELGRRAKICRCESENVHIDVDAVLEESALREAAAVAREERRLQAEARKEFKENKRSPREKRERKPRPPGEKRIRKLKVRVPTVDFKLPPKPSKPVFPCILCPDRSSTQMMPVHRVEAIAAPIPSSLPAAVEPKDSNVITTDGTRTELSTLQTVNPEIVPEPVREKVKKPEFAHLACVRSTPELWIADVWDHVREKSVRKVMGIETVGRERWNLKCSTCQDDPIRHKHGTKIQCTKGKCVKAYHVTCAIRDPDVEFREMEVDEWVASPADEPKPDALEDVKMEGNSTITPLEPTSAITTPAAIKFQKVTVVHAHMLCPAHNPAVVERKRREAKQTIVDALLQSPYGSPVSIRLGTGTWGSFLLSIDSQTETAVVTNDKGVPFDVKWNQIVYMAPITQLATSTRMVADTSKPESVRSPIKNGLPIQSQSTAASDPISSMEPEGNTSVSSSDTKSTTDLLASNDLQHGAQVVLTPGMIKMLSGNPLLRAGLREIGLA